METLKFTDNGITFTADYDNHNKDWAIMINGPMQQEFESAPLDAFSNLEEFKEYIASQGQVVVFTQADLVSLDDLTSGLSENNNINPELHDYIRFDSCLIVGREGSMNRSWFWEVEASKEAFVAQVINKSEDIGIVKVQLTVATNNCETKSVYANVKFGDIKEIVPKDRYDHYLRCIEHYNLGILEDEAAKRTK